MWKLLGLLLSAWSYVQPESAHYLLPRRIHQDLPWRVNRIVQAGRLLNSNYRLSTGPGPALSSVGWSASVGDVEIMEGEKSFANLAISSILLMASP